MSPHPRRALTYTPPPSGAGAEQILEALGLAQGEEVQYRPDHEAPDDLRATLYDAISYEFDQEMGGWELLPRSIQHEDEVLRVTMVPLLAVYEAEQDQEPEAAPRERVLEMMDEYHQEAREDTVPLAEILEQTPGAEPTVLEAVERLEREGEVYQPKDGEYRRTGWA